MKKIRGDRNFQPVGVDESDELFPNGIFEFNITKLLAFITEAPEKFPVEEVEVNEVRQCPSSSLDEETIKRANLADPIILGEISPGRFNVIDGNHRLERAHRDGLKTIPARRIFVDQHLRFLTSHRAYVTYVDYWNSKVDDAEEDMRLAGKR